MSFFARRKKRNRVGRPTRKFHPVSVRRRAQPEDAAYVRIQSRSIGGLDGSHCASPRISLDGRRFFHPASRNPKLVWDAEWDSR